MNNFRYFLQYISIIFFFLLFKLIGLKFASFISEHILKFFGPLFRSKKIISQNIQRAFPNITFNQKKNLINKMWSNYGKILAEYIFIKDFRHKESFQKKIKVVNQKILDDIINGKSPVIFISGHFNNFELMAMYIEKSGIDLAAVYRPLNNKFLNPIMEKMRKKYICKYQIKKGIPGTKDLLKHFKNRNSIALMIDQRVSEGIMCKFFGQDALTTTLPAQFVKKFNTKIVPVYIQRYNHNNFDIEFYEPLSFSKNETIFDITLKLNKIIEQMIIKNPDQWIWTHNRWK